MKLLVILCVFTVGRGLPITVYYQKSSPAGGGHTGDGEKSSGSMQGPFHQETYHFPIPPSDFLFRRVIGATNPPPPFTNKKGSESEGLKFPISYRIPIYRSTNSTSSKKTSLPREGKKEVEDEDAAAMSHGFSWASMFFYILAIDEDSLVWPSALEWLDKGNYNNDELSLSQEKDSEELDIPSSIEDIKLSHHHDGKRNGTTLSATGSLDAPASFAYSEELDKLLLGYDDKMNASASSTTVIPNANAADDVDIMSGKNIVVEIATEMTSAVEEVTSTHQLELGDDKQNKTVVIDIMQMSNST